MESLRYIGFFCLFAGFLILRYLWRKKRVVRKINEYFSSRGYSVLSIHGLSIDLLSRTTRGVYTIVLQKGKKSPRCCLVDTAHFKGLTWHYIENRQYCDNCGSLYNSDEYTACPDCFGQKVNPS